MSVAVPEVKLSDGRSLPSVGLGTWEMDDKEAEEAVMKAIDLGYRHIDTAYIYHNEVGVGKAIRKKISEGVVKREDVFVTSKLWNIFHKRKDVLPACRRSLRYLSLQYVDLYLVHWPFGLTLEKEVPNPQVFDGFDDTSIEDTWREMERCVDEGLAKSIGVSNFNSIQLIRVLNMARIKPVINQVECHLGLDQRPLIGLCKERGVLVTGYCPLGAPGRAVKRRGEDDLLEHAEVVALAKQYRKTPAQIALRYLLEVIPIPKTTNKDHMKENLNIFDFKLQPSEMDTLDKLNSDNRIISHPLARHHLDYPFKIPF